MLSNNKNTETSNKTTKIKNDRSRFFEAPVIQLGQIISPHTLVVNSFINTHYDLLVACIKHLPKDEKQGFLDEVVSRLSIDSSHENQAGVVSFLEGFAFGKSGYVNFRKETTDVMRSFPVRVMSRIYSRLNAKEKRVNRWA